MSSPSRSACCAIRSSSGSSPTTLCAPKPKTTSCPATVLPFAGRAVKDREFVARIILVRITNCNSGGISVPRPRAVRAAWPLPPVPGRPREPCCPAPRARAVRPAGRGRQRTGRQAASRSAGRFRRRTPLRACCPGVRATRTARVSCGSGSRRTRPLRSVRVPNRPVRLDLASPSIAPSSLIPYGWAISTHSNCPCCGVRLCRPDSAYTAFTRKADRTSAAAIPIWLSSRLTTWPG